MTMATGHLLPYRDGELLPAANGYPLGLLAEAANEEVRSELASGDRFTFVSDGILEARDAKGRVAGL